MSYGVFRARTTPSLRRKFIPSKTAAVSASLLFNKRIDLNNFDEQYESALYVRNKFIPAKSISLVTKKSKPNLSYFDEYYGHGLYLKSKFIATDRTASLPFVKSIGRHYKPDADYRLYKNNKVLFGSAAAVTFSLAYKKSIAYRLPDRFIHPEKNKYIWAISASLVIGKKKSFHKYEYRHDNEFYKKGSFVLSSPSVVAASLLFKNKKPIIKDEKYRSYKKPNFIFLTSSSLVAKKRILPIIEPVSHSLFGVNKKHIGSTGSQSLLYIPPKRLELLIINAIEEYKYYHYKRKEDYRIIGTVTPPPSDGSFIFRSRTRNWVELDDSYYYNIKARFRLREFLGGPNVGFLCATFTLKPAIKGAITLTPAIKGTITLNKDCT